MTTAFQRSFGGLLAVICQAIHPLGCCRRADFCRAFVGQLRVARRSFSDLLMASWHSFAALLIRNLEVFS
jgi:hypothetical protein